MPSKTDQKLINHFKERLRFSREELYGYFLKQEEDLKPGTFGWRIYALRKKGVLRQVQRGWYTVQEKRLYAPQISSRLKKLSKLITENYKEARYCVWNSDWLNEFALHQINKSIDIIEIEKDLTSSLLHFLHDRNFKSIVTQETYDLIPIDKTSSPVLILPLISRSPLQEVDEDRSGCVSIPTLEKILVDIFSNEKIFHFVQGYEMFRIYEAATKRHSINYTTLISYAERRNKGNELKDYLKKHFAYSIEKDHP